MWKWIKRRELIARHVTTSDAPAAGRQWAQRLEGAKVPSKYASLHEYLANRYADSVVLTFAQLEDLLGCALPDSARVQHEWWTSTDRDAGKSSCSDAWILAGRTATPNLLARTVAFERQAEPFETHGPSSDDRLGRDCRRRTRVLGRLVTVSTRGKTVISVSSAINGSPNSDSDRIPSPSGERTLNERAWESAPLVVESAWRRQMGCVCLAYSASLAHTVDSRFPETWSTPRSHSVVSPHRSSL